MVNFKKNLPVLLLMGLVLIICGLNFKFGNWLTGWDNLHPEFDFSLNIKRSLNSVWQEYQGLGLLGGMGHAADLPRQIFLGTFSLFLPTFWLRPLFIFLMLLVGTLGIFYLLRLLLKDDWPAFFGALFYLLNLATVQFFYVPFEAFIAHYAFLPWLFYCIFSFFGLGSKRYLVLFFVLSLVSSSQAYVPTLFVVYFLAFVLVSLGIFFQERNRKTLKRFFILFLIILLANAYWLLPFGYFTVTSASVVGQAQENFMATENIFLRNKEFGRLEDVFLLKGFWFKFTDFDKNGELDYMVKSWRDYLSYPWVLTLGYLEFGFVILGLIYAILKKQKYFLPPLFLFFLSLLMLANDAPIFSTIVEFLQTKIPLFLQVFRVPFTKFAILASFTYSLFFGIGFYFLFSMIKKRSKLPLGIFSVGILLILIIFVWPIFRGELIYENNQLKIPEKYFEVFNYFKNQPLGRIANFPQHTFWGWNYYNWGYVGSGFLWYGIRQPILDRAFDGYSRPNENYYHEVSCALYSQNLPLFEKILEKYQINWLLVDGNVVSYTSPKSLYFDQLEQLIGRSRKISLAAEFGKIKIYQVNLGTQPKDFVFLAQDLPEIGPTYKWNNFDQAYLDSGNYLTDPISNFQLLTSEIYYPFRSLFTGRRQEELEFEVEEKENEIVFKTRIPQDFIDGNLVLPEFLEPEVLQVDEQDLNKVKIIKPELNFKNDLEVRIPKAEGMFTYDSQKTEDLLKKEPQSCDAFNKGEFGLEKIKIDKEEGLRFSALNQASCLDLVLPKLENRFSYLITVKSGYKEGKSLLFWLENLQSRKADIETYLPKDKKMTTSYFVQPPMAQDGLGYSLHFNNISIGRVKSINDLEKVTVYPIPYKFLTGIKIVKTLPTTNHQPPITNFKVSHPNESFYKIEITKPQPLGPSTFLVLSQSFSKDWLAFEKTGRFSFRKLDNHVLINNWANGWQLPITNYQLPITIYIFFWPQILEYLGFLLLLMTPIIIWRIKIYNFK